MSYSKPIDDLEQRLPKSSAMMGVIQAGKSCELVAKLPSAI